MVMKTGLATYLTEKREQLRGLALCYGITLKKVKIDFLFEFQQGAWKERITLVEGYGSHNPDRFTEAEVFKREATKLFTQFVHGVIATPSRNIFILHPELQGRICPGIKPALPVMGMKTERREVRPQPGMVTVMFIWSIETEHARKYLYYHRALFHQYPEWMGKLRVMEFNSDSNVDFAVAEVVYEQWEWIEHYWLPKEAWNGVWAQIPSRHGPYHVLLDSNARVVLAGDSRWVCIENNLPKLMRGEPITLQFPEMIDEPGIEKTALKDPKYGMEQARTDLEKITTACKEDFACLSDLAFTLSYKHIYREEKPPEVYGNLSCNCKYLRKQRAAIERINNELGQTFKNKLELRLQFEEKRRGTVEFGQKCVKCSRVLNQRDQYLCVTCNPKRYYCLECMQTSDTVTRPLDHLHPHGLYFIQKDSATVMDELLVMSIKNNPLKEDASKQHDLVCALCETKPIVVRFKCANCNSFDICGKCFKITKTPSHSQYAAFLKKAQTLQHDINKHVYIREDFVGTLTYPH